MLQRRRQANHPEPPTPALRHTPADRPRRRQRVVTASWLAEATRERAVTPRRKPPQTIAVGTGSAAGRRANVKSSTPARILVLAQEATATPALIEAVHARAARGACAFTLLVPRSAHGLRRLTDAQNDESGEALHALEEALPLLEQAAGAPVGGMVGDPTPLTAVEDAVNARGFDEIIVHTPPARLLRWLRLDLPSKVTGLGLPTTTVNP